MHPIVSAAQRAARRISMKARRNLGKKVRIMDEPQIIPISPRPGKTPGIIKMPDFLNDKSDISTNNSKIRSKAGIHVCLLIFYFDHLFICFFFISFFEL